MKYEFKVYDHVLIKAKNIPGQIIDMHTAKDGTRLYIVESDIEGYADDPDSWGGLWPLYDCTADQLELIEPYKDEHR